ncbi:MAG: 16S rRNA (uracil(1498)-N(3))-methyltransferase [Pseudomonadota bacterium]
MRERPRRRLHIDATLRANERVTLERDRAHYLTRVLRLDRGAAVTLFNGDGLDYDGVIVDIARNQAVIEIETTQAARSGLDPAVVIALPILKGERMDFALQKATELGASRFLLTTCSRGDVALSADRLDNRLRHWLGVVRSACEQCGRATVPTIEPPRPLRERLADSGPLAVCLDASGEPPQVALTRSQWRGELRLFSGPEGGFAADELEALSGAAQLVRHGALTLRAETAPLVGLTLVGALRELS